MHFVQLSVTCSRFAEFLHVRNLLLKSLIQDYRTLLSQLEHAFNSSSQFSLQKLWFYVHPTVHTLSLIYQLTLELATADQDDTHSESESDIDPEEEARNEALGVGGAKLRAILSEITKNGVSNSSGIPVKGGEVLTIIYDRMQNMNGDPTASTIYGTLLRAAGKPYVDMIKDWVSTGKLVDPYEELLVKESKFINREILEMDYTDEYWERRYTVSTIDDCDEMEFIPSIIASCETVRPPPHRSDLKPVSHPFVLVASCQVVPAFPRPWRDGNIRYSWLENT